MFNADLPMISFPESDISQTLLEPRKKRVCNVLVIDNDSATIDFLNSYLPTIECAPIKAESLNDAVEKCKKFNISLVVSEFFLGNHTCLDIVLMLHKINPKLPIAIMSADQDLINEKDALNYSADFFISKPLQSENLQRIINKCTYQFSAFS